MPQVIFDYEVNASAAEEFNKLSAEIDRSLEDYQQKFESTNQARVQSERETTQQISREQKKMTRETQREARLQAFAWRDVGFALSDISRGFQAAERTLGRFTSEIIGAAAGLETYRASIQAVTNDTASTNRALSTLLELTVDLVGIETETLIAYSARLQAAGLSADMAATAIEGVTKRVAEQGKSSAVTQRALEQFTQAINTDIISYRDFIPILRQMPTLYRDFSSALQTPVKNLDDLRAAADAVGGPAAAVTLTMQHMAQVARGADLDTLNAQLDIFYDSSRVLGAELGEHLIPAVVFFFREINAGIQWFRSLSDEAQSAIAWSAALGTGFTALVGAVGSVSAALAFLNANLIATTGVGGLAGLGTLLAPAGPIVAGFGLATAAIAPFVALIVKSRVEMNNARRASSEFARQVSRTIAAVGNTEAIETQIRSLQDYIDTQKEVIRQNEITSESFRDTPSRARASFVSRSGSQARAAEERVALAERQIELLGRLDNLSEQSADDLRELDRLLAQLLREARQAGDNNAVRELERSVAGVLGAFKRLETGAVRVFSNSEPIRNFAKEIVELQNAAEGAFGFENEIRAARELGRVQLEQIDAEIQNAARPFIERQELSEEERQRAVEDLQALGAERLRIEIDTNASVARVNQSEYENWKTLQENRISLLQQLRALEVQGFQDAAAQGGQLAGELERIASPRFRQEFYQQVQAFQAMGLSFERASELAHQAVEFNRQLLFSYRDTTTQAEKLAAAHAETFDSVRSQINLATEGMREFIDETQLAIDSLAVFDRNRLPETGQASPFDESRRAVPIIPRDQRTTPLDTSENEFGIRLQQIKEEEREVQRSLRQQERHYRQFANQVSRVFEGVATGRINSFSEVAKEFLTFSLRIVSRAVIENTILKNLDDTLTAHKIANIERLAAAQAGSSGLGGGLGHIRGLSNLFSGGGLALGVSALLFPQESQNLLSGIRSEIGGFLENIGDSNEIVVKANITNNLRIGDNEAREISDLTEEMREGDRL